MWFTVAKNEFGWRKAGTVFIAKKDYAGYVKLFPIKYGTSKDGKTIPVADPKNYVHIDSRDALRFCTKPSKDFDSVIEESIMICEGAYC
jgi:hypothetical protein